MRSTAYTFGSALGALLLGVTACSDPNEGTPPGTFTPGAQAGTAATAGTGNNAGSTGLGNPVSTAGNGGDIVSGGCIGDECMAPSGGGDADKPAPPGCGDGTRTDDEACDDANTTSGDGCSANCLVVEQGFSCAEPGAACLPIALCGDGIVAPSEQCDDNGKVPGDGCADTCKFEKGFTCEGEPSVCRPTTCGDGVQEGAESCDDGNVIPFDGCSDSCSREPACPGPGGACTSECGDGIKIGVNEECDDGNRLDGDGCSADCKEEAGFTCAEAVVECEEQIGGDCIIRVPVLYRDFGVAHPDFGKNPNECTTTFEEGGDPIPGNVVTTGMVDLTLDADGRPTLASGLQECENNDDGPDANTPLASYQGISSQMTFAQWFRDDATNLPLPRQLILFDNGEGGYVNRFNDDGDQFEGYVAGSEEGGDDFVCSWCLSSDCTDRCTADEETYDGSPLFFPIDDAPATFFDSGEAKVPAEYGYTGWPWEGDVPGLRDEDHNFYFTTEVKTWFEYTADIDAQLDFTGDDDVWVFVNGHLALDLGGIHAPTDDSVQINSGTAARYGLEVGQVYSLVVFQAERRMEGSSFRLTLSGFNPSPSVCVAECGDGIVSFGEECDNGANNTGGYGQCNSMCRLGEFCGDGIINGDEECEQKLGGAAPCVACRILNAPQ